MLLRMLSCMLSSNPCHQAYSYSMKHTLALSSYRAYSHIIKHTCMLSSTLTWPNILSCSRVH
jgi:hypothetical protein